MAGDGKQSYNGANQHHTPYASTDSNSGENLHTVAPDSGHAPLSHGRPCYSPLGLTSPGLPGHMRSRVVSGLQFAEFHSEARQTTLAPAVFSLVNTVVGGGVLSLSYSFQQAGALMGAILLTVVCLATDFTLFALVSASRRTGSRTFEGVMKAAFGRPAQLTVVILVLIVTFLTPVAYLILLRDLISPIVEAYITRAPLSSAAKTVIILVVALGVTPLTSLKTMGAIGALATLSMGSMVVLAAVIGVRSIGCVRAEGMPQLALISSNRVGILACMPVFVSSLLCHFNVPPVFAELRRPTRKRAHFMVHLTMIVTLALYLFVGLAGLTYGACHCDTGKVPGNVLLAFPADDPLVNLARAALTVVLCFCLPLIIRPCRDSILRLVEIIAEARSGSPDQPNATSPLLGLVPSDVDDDCLSPYIESEDSIGINGEEAVEGERREGGKGPEWTKDVRISNLIAYTLALTCVAIASVVHSVEVIWAVMGSTSCIALAFIFPTAAYLRVGCLRQRLKRLIAWAICVSGILLTVLCVGYTIYSLATGQVS